VSVTVRLDPKVKAAVAAIGPDAWQTIEYTDAVYDQTTGRWISRAEVAEIDFIAFSGQKKADHVPGRLVVRRVPDLNPKANQGQDTLFDTWRFHAFFTTTDPAVLDTVATDKTHRGHAVIEQVHADLKNSALAHLPSGKFAANAAWLVLAVIAFNLTRARCDPHRTRFGPGHHGHHPTQTDHRPGTTRVLGTAAHPAPTESVALADRLDPGVRPRVRATRPSDHLTTQPRRPDSNQRGTP